MKRLKELFILLFSLFQGFYSIAQNPDNLALIQEYKTTLSDTHKVTLLVKIGNNYLNEQNFDSVFATIDNGFQLLDKSSIKFFEGYSRMHNLKGFAFYNQGKNKDAVESYKLAVKYADEGKLNSRKAKALLNMGLSYSELVQYQQAQTCYQEASDLFLKEKDVNGYERCQINMMTILVNQQLYRKAIDLCLSKVEEFNKANGDNACGIYHTLGNAYDNNYQMDSSMYYYNLAIDCYTGKKRVDKVSECYNNIGVALIHRRRFAEAETQLLKAFELKRGLNNKYQEQLTNLNIGISQSYLGKTKEALARFDTVIAYSIKEGALELSTEAYKSKVVCNLMVQHSDIAMDDFNKYITLVDSMGMIQNSAQLAEMQTKYETEKKVEQIKGLEVEKELDKKMRYAFILLAIAGFIVTVIIFVAYRNKKRSNHLLTKQKTEILEKNNALAESNELIQEQKREITSSILYAKRIQQAILPDLGLIQSEFKDSFVLFTPKDIVSGDFYYYHKVDSASYIAAADCTGHGVPGAFMSLLAKENLDKAIANYSKPAEILANLNRYIKLSLKQSDSDESTRDGLDISFLKVEKNKMVYAGANRPLWIFKKTDSGFEFEEIKATKTAIGGRTPNEQEFDEHSLELKKGDSVYLLSDGFADQFGGEHQKKITTKRLKEFLFGIQGQSMHEQQIQLSAFYEKWKGNIEQVDDILVIGIRF